MIETALLLLVVLGGSPPYRLPDLQVEAVSETGAALLDLTEAVGRALVGSGGRVVLGSPNSAPCNRCVKIRVTESGPGSFRVEVYQHGKLARSMLRLPDQSSLFDRARAIAIHVRLLAGGEEREHGSLGKGRPEGKEAQAPVEVAPVPPPASAASEVAEPSDPFEPRVEPRTVASEGEAEGSGPEPARASPAKEEVEEDSAGPRPVVAEVNLTRSRKAWRWPWLPMVVGTAAAVSAGACAMLALSRYTSLANKMQPYDSAQSLKSSGQSWQLASFILSGVAAAGVGVGIVGFALGSPDARPEAGKITGGKITAMVAPVPGGGLAALEGAWP
ncbi:MAG: hypothetical protein ABSB49_16875 [Polyangia bacterium]|jgi:hypothetical protein